MEKYNVLILTDHTHHSAENSIYAFAPAWLKHQSINKVDVATRAFAINDSFFKDFTAKSLWVATVTKAFSYTEQAAHYKHNFREEPLTNYDLVWLRLPPPLSKPLADYLSKVFATQYIINNPQGIYATGTKAFLTNFSEVCAPMKICTSIQDIIEFKQHFPIVLKPFRDYGGKGIVKIEGNTVWYGQQVKPFKAFADTLQGQEISYLGVKFLKNVSKGDKRIVVIDGKPMGASLRLPAANSWLCNVAMGGTSHSTTITEEEFKIVETVNPILSKMGIVMYGLDTLVNDGGKRVLSEINTTSIGGLPQIAKQQNQALVDKAVALLINNFTKNHINVK